MSCNHPEKEFLESQINTLKSIVAKREAELKKVQESDKLKSKKIMLLEAQLNEARKSILSPDNTSEISHDSERKKIETLELKTNHLEDQIAILFSKLEIQTENDSPQIIEQTRNVFICHICGLESLLKEDLKKHISSIHTSTTVSASAPTGVKGCSLEFKCINCEYITPHLVGSHEMERSFPGGRWMLSGYPTRWREHLVEGVGSRQI